ncbi:MAG: response regulator [Desulfobulbaceae bacterium]|nr:response regulator [Desulfobulbaceae bacterium]HIJ90317.1 response regulator [Deltaproteobacteria bacterium]
MELTTPPAILAVDDDPAILKTISLLLTKEGYAVYTAENGANGLEILKKQAIDLLLLDIRMPQMDGLEMLKLAKEYDPNIATIILTGIVKKELLTELMHLGCYGYILKPFANTEIVLNVVNALRRHKLELADKKQQETLEHLVSQRTRELKDSQNRIIQQEKMAAIGCLAAGVAHEINNPVGFIMSNLGSLAKYLEKIKLYLADLEADEEASQDPEARRQRRKNLKIDFILQDIEGLIAESQDGCNRIKTIVSNLKCFSRTDKEEAQLVNINDNIETTLTIVWNELKYKAQVVKEFGELPLSRCLPQQLNQVFMNLLVNAAHAMESQGIITIRTWTEDNAIFISITDTGKGIPKENLTKIFEPLPPRRWARVPGWA